MVAVWKCAALAMIAIGGMGIAALLCAVGTSWALVAERVVYMVIYAATDLSVGMDGGRRRCAAWLLVVVLITVVLSVHPVGGVFGYFLYFLIIDCVMPRDASTRRRSAPSLYIGMMYWLNACRAMSVYYGYDEAGLVLSGIHKVVLIVGVRYVQKGVDAASLTTSDCILLAGTLFNNITYTFFQIAGLPVHAFVRSLLLVLLQRPFMKLLVPLAKCLYGDDGCWCLGVVIVLCAMEIQPAFMLTGAATQSMELYLLMVFQEANALLKNLGFYFQIYCNFCAYIGRPVSQQLSDVAEARRRVIAPCDCLAELIAPFIVAVYVVSTNPRMRPLLVLFMALAVRIAFTMLEVYVERRRALCSGGSTPVSEVMVDVVVDADPRRICALLCVLALQPFLFVIYACVSV